MMISLVGVCLVDESPGYVAYVQDDESSVTNGSDGAYVIIVKDLVAYAHLAEGEKSRLIPVERLTNLWYPKNAALAFSGDDNETAFMVEVSNISLSDGMKYFTLLVNSLPYFEGEQFT